MKALVIGLGSMGKRRVRNLRGLGVRDIWGFERDARAAADARRAAGVDLLPRLSNLKQHQFDLAVISTPPGAHLAAARACARSGVPFFVELNLSLRESRAIAAMGRKHRVQVFFSDTERFDSDILEVGALVGRRFRGYFAFHLGQNIHDWHPWQKPGVHFIFKPATSGIREMLRVELPWMLRLFGSVASLNAQSARFETKKYGVDDYMTVELKFASGAVGLLVLDLLSPQVIKRLDVVSAKQHIVWHERENRVEVRRHGGTRIVKNLRSKHTLERYQFPEDAHLAEMSHVLSVLNGHCRSLLTGAAELQVLRLIDRIEQVSRRGQSAAWVGGRA